MVLLPRSHLVLVYILNFYVQSIPPIDPVSITPWIALLYLRILTLSCTTGLSKQTQKSGDVVPVDEDSRALLTRAELLCSLADANSAAALAQWYKW